MSTQIPAYESDKDFPTLELWLKRYKQSEEYHSEYAENGKRNYKLYKAYTEASAKTYQHQIFVPYTFAYVEDLTASMLLSIFAGPTVYSLTPWWTSITPELCKELEQLLQWVIVNEECEFALEIEELLKMICIYNVGYLVNYPITRDDDIPGMKEGTRSTRESFSRLHLDTPHSLDIFPQPRAKRLSRSTWIIKRSVETIDNLKKMEKDGIYKNVGDIGSSSSEDAMVAQLLHEIEQVPVNFNPGTVEILDCMEDGHIVTIANFSTIIRDTKKQYEDRKPILFDFPMLDCRLNGAPGEFMGMGVVEQIAPQQLELNTLRSQRRDNISLLLNKLFIYDMMAGEVDLSTLISAPGNVIITTNRNCLDEFPISDVTGSSYKEEESITSDMQNVSALHDYARGVAPRRKETATGIIRLQQAAQARSEWMIRKIDEYVLMPLARRILVYLRQYLAQSDYANIIGTDNHSDEFYNIKIDDLKRGIRVRPLTESIQSTKEIDMNQFMMAFDRLIKLPPNTINHLGLIKQLLMKLGQRDIKEILPALSKEGKDSLQAGLPAAQQNMATFGMAAPMNVPGQPGANPAQGGGM